MNKTIYAGLLGIFLVFGINTSIAARGVTGDSADDGDCGGSGSGYCTPCELTIGILCRDYFSGGGADLDWAQRINSAARRSGWNTATGIYTAVMGSGGGPTRAYYDTDRLNGSTNSPFNFVSVTTTDIESTYEKIEEVCYYDENGFQICGPMTSIVEVPYYYDYAGLQFYKPLTGRFMLSLTYQNNYSDGPWTAFFFLGSGAGAGWSDLGVDDRFFSKGDFVEAALFSFDEDVVLPPTGVPEPSGLALTILALTGLLVVKRRRSV